MLSVKLDYMTKNEEGNINLLDSLIIARIDLGITSHQHRYWVTYRSRLGLSKTTYCMFRLLDSYSKECMTKCQNSH